MKAIHRIAILFVVMFLSLTVVTSLFTLFTTDVRALNVVSVNVSGPIITHTIWTKANSPYILTDEVTVNEGITLTIEPGVTVMGQLDTRLAINGRLEAIGTSTEPITFTSVLSSAPGEWQGLLIADAGITGSAHLNHVVVEYGEFNIGVFSQDDATIITKIENTVTQFSEGAGMSMSTYSLHLTELDNVTFNSNNKDRIIIEVWPEYLSGNVTLTAQPGLEGYELLSDADFIIPAGITLTVESGVTIFMPEDMVFRIKGHLEAIGTPPQPVTFTSITSSTPGEWVGISIEEKGSTHLNHAVVQYSWVGFAITLEGDGPHSKIENTTIQFVADVGMEIKAQSLHLVELNNVTFEDNFKNRIALYAGGTSGSLIENVILTAQPGLEGYEVISFDPGLDEFVIPTGITLTIEPDVTLFMPEDSDISVNGHLEAIGSPSQPITFTSISNSFTKPWYGLFVFEDSSVHLNHAVIQYAYANVGFYLHNSDRISIIENTHIQYGGNIGIQIASHSLHLVELDNVTFKENGKNRIEIGVNYHSASLLDNATLTYQPGLEGYEFYPYNSGELTFTIPANISLTVEPDVTLYMEKGKFVVNGRLQATGTPTQPITFTSITTDTNQWEGIVVDGGNTELTHTNIQYSQGNGLEILAGSVTARCSILTDNLGSGIFIGAAAQGNVQLEYNSLVSNTVAGLRNESPGWIDARYNWWGAADGPSGSGPGSGDAVIGNVVYTPWLTESECQDIAAVNLEVAQSVMTTTNTLTYTIDITNHTTTTATQVVLTDTLPAQATLIEAPAYCTGFTELVCNLAYISHLSN